MAGVMVIGSGFAGGSSGSGRRAGNGGGAGEAARQPRRADGGARPRQRRRQSVWSARADGAGSRWHNAAAANTLAIDGLEAGGDY